MPQQRSNENVQYCGASFVSHRPKQFLEPRPLTSFFRSFSFFSEQKKQILFSEARTLCFFFFFLHDLSLSFFHAQAEKLLDRGIHPVRIGEGFDRACQAAVKHLETIADAVEFSKDNTEVRKMPHR